MVDRVAVGQILPYRVLQYSPVSIIPPLLHAHLHLTKTNMRSLGTFQNQCAFGNQVAMKRQLLPSFFFFWGGGMQALFIRHQR